MIITPEYAIGHIGKTGGDAAKQFVSALSLPDVRVFNTNDPAKHTPTSEYKDSNDKALTFRRLPWRIVSYYQHKIQRDRIISSFPTIEQICDERESEEEYLKWASLGPHSIIRCENLYQDLIHYIAPFHDIADSQITLAVNAPKKRSLRYSRTITDWFTEDDLRKLYSAHLNWTARERCVYGGLLTI